MTSVRARLSEFGLRRFVFSAVVLAFFGLFVLTGGWRLLADSVAGWFENGLGLHDEFEPAHRIHFVTFSVMIWPAVVGMLAALWSPREHLAAQFMALLPWVGLVVAFALTGFWDPFVMIGIFGSLVLLATLLHPAGRELVTWFDASQVSRLMLALVLVAAVPLLAFTATQVGLQTGAIEQAGHAHGAAGSHAEVHEQHVEHGHFALMTAFGLVVLGMGLLSSLRPTGWWLPAGVTGALAMYFGAASVTFPETASSAGTAWGLAAVAWGSAFVAATVLIQRHEPVAPYGDRKPTIMSED